jgi:nicotinamide-nucleotide amidase
MFDAEIMRLATDVLAAARAKGITIVTAESCTGGLVAAALTEIAGSSDVVDRGFVTYSNAAKQAHLGVPEATLAAFGAVSEETARAMAAGALAASAASLAISVTGIAGPGGGSPDKPVGRVHLATARGWATIHRRLDLGDIGRSAVRRGTVVVALAMLAEAINAP